MATRKGRGRGTPAFVPNIDMLSEQEQEQLRAQAKKEIAEDMKKAARTAALEAFKDEARRAVDPDEELFSFQIDLPGHADRITIDGISYLHGGTYEFTKKELDTIREVQSRAWRHEDEVGGANRDFYRAPRNVRVGPNDIGRPNSSLMRV